MVFIIENLDFGLLLFVFIFVINEKDMYLVFKFSLIGKGKRRRLFDEDVVGEFKVKRLKYIIDNKEFILDDGIYW